MAAWFGVHRAREARAPAEEGHIAARWRISTSRRLVRVSQNGKHNAYHDREVTRKKGRCFTVNEEGEIESSA